MSTEGTKENSGGAIGDEIRQQMMEMYMSYPSTPSYHIHYSTATFETENELIKRTFALPPEMLEEIMKKLDKENILNCRGVSKMWNNVAKGILENEVMIRQLENRQMLQDFCDTIKSSIEGISLTFQHLNFYGDTIPSITIEHPLNSIKQHVTRLQWNAVDQIRLADGMLQLIYNHLPNLKKVHIELSGTTEAMEALPSDFEAKMIPYSGKTLLQLEDMLFAIRVRQPGRYLKRINCFFKTLIASAVNLKHLSLNSWNRVRKAKIQENVISSISSCKIQKIKMEQFWTSVKNVDALSKHHLEFPLTKLTLKIDLNKVDMEPLLNRCSLYLTELDLEFTEDHAQVNFPFGVNLNKLWSLTLKDAKEQFYIEWSRMPQIRKLVLLNGSLNGIVTPMISSPSHCTHLQTLRILPYEHCDIQLFSPLLNQMLTHLNSQLTSLSLNVWCGFEPPLALIFKECTSLKCLDLWLGDYSDGKLADEGLCGVEDPNVLTVTRPEDNLVEGGAEDLDDEASLDFPYRFLVNQVKNPDVAPRRQFPYIGNLKELHILELHGRFTELALLHGIVHCRSLTRMNLDSLLICRKKAARIIRNADLIHLRSARVNYQLINHLPEESPGKVLTRSKLPPPTRTVPTRNEPPTRTVPSLPTRYQPPPPTRTVPTRNEPPTRTVPTRYEQPPTTTVPKAKLKCSLL